MKEISKNILVSLKDMFTPNKNISKTSFYFMIGVQIIIFLLLWFNSSSELFPTPKEILSAGKKMILEEKIIPELWESTMLSVKSMTIATIVSLIISYLTVLPFFRPISDLLTKFRFLSLVGLTFVFTLLTSGGHELKISILVFAISVFFITSMNAVISSISKGEFNYARTLRMGEWESVWYVVILGKLDQVFEIIRQNFAISWMMLTMVEGISRSDGGIGTVLLNQNKHLHLDAVFAIQIIILIVGIVQDYLIGIIKNLVCPYSSIKLERK
jgi:NitT/TauT family transport system permease protein